MRCSLHSGRNDSMANRLKLGFVTAALAVLAFAACQKPVSYTKFANDTEVPRITLADAKKDFDADSAVFIDSRAEPAFKSEHVTGSISVPFGMQESMMDKIPKGKKIIIYCS
jgi:hypothetical protein